MTSAGASGALSKKRRGLAGEARGGSIADTRGADAIVDADVPAAAAAAAAACGFVAGGGE
jgi:hypothetical protein